MILRPRRCFAAALTIGLSSPSAAQAQQCVAPLEAAAQAASRLPGSVPFEVSDQLQAYHDEAIALAEEDGPGCLAIVAKMNALIARYMPGGRGRAPQGGASQASSRETGPARTGPGRPRNGAEREISPGDDEERLKRRIERATDEEADHLRAVGAYRDAAHNYANAMRRFAQADGTSSGRVVGLDAAITQIDDELRSFEQIVVLNAPEDVMHARLEDAVRRVEDARRALEGAWERYHARGAAKAEDYIAPLTSPGFQPAPLERDFVAPLGDAETRAAQARLRNAERALKQVRNSWNPYVHRGDWAFLDLRDGYKQAYKGEYDRFAAVLKALDDTLGSYLPDRSAAFDRRREELYRQHEERLDAILRTHAIP